MQICSIRLGTSGRRDRTLGGPSPDLSFSKVLMRTPSSKGGRPVSKA